ncbi:MAG: SusC/RagA family TonB-linked outer membrane protein [Bacteroidales bacterium]|nr:SusC/RagA family TonB-linked outer membrane protein [Bacteroidales bacterium]
MVLLTLSFAAAAQNMNVRGTVKDAAGEAIVGANVVLQGSRTVYTMTDLNGAFSLNVPANGVLDVNCMGYLAQSVPVSGRTSIDIVLQDDNQLLDETIVVAFGTSTREAFTGSAAVVNEEKLAKSQVVSVTNALAGAVAGVQLTSSNGAPGSTGTLRVRGYSSINAGLSPLIIVDGAPYEGDLSNLNSNDIASMTVLKDAASNALYGARGANGVIMITTKRAKAGEATVTFDAKVGVNTKALQNYDVITDPRMYYETHYKALANYYELQGLSAGQAWVRANQNIGGEQGNGGLGYIVYTVPDGEFLIGSNGKLNPNATLGRTVGDYYMTPDDWAAEGYRKGLRQEYNLSASGSTDRSSFYTSLAYLNEEGITRASDLERFTGRLRADYQVKEWLKLTANVSYTRFNGNSLSNNGSSGSTGNIWAFTSQIAPIYPLWVRNADGSIYYDANNIAVMDYGNGELARGGFPGYARPFLSDANALQQVRLNTNNYEGNASTGNFAADFTIIPGLTFTANGTYNLDETRSTYVYNPYYGQFRSTGGTVEKYHTRMFNYNLQQILRYNHTFGAEHHLTLTLGHEYTNNRNFSLGASKSKMFSQANKELNGAIQDGQSSSSYITEYNNEGFFFNGQYDYATKYFLSASFRRDASSRFAPAYRWGNFWSVGGAWIISKEPWFNVAAIDELKLKASFGSQGNDNIGNFRYTDTFDISNSSGSIGTSFRAKGTEDITWETNSNFNAGVEFSFLNRISGGFEYFYRKTTDMLFSFSVAPSLGYSNYWDNVGDLYNSGEELELNFNIINKKNVKWDLNFNMTHLNNKITKLHEDKKTSTLYDLDGNAYKGYNNDGAFVSEGLPLYTFREKEFAGIDPETGKSLWYKNTFAEDTPEGEDPQWTGRETTDDWSTADYYVTHKTAIPDLYGGLGTTFYAYGFDFSINTSFQLGGYQYDGTYASFMSTPLSSSTGQNMHVDVLKAWTTDNPSKDIPRWVFGDTYSAGRSTRFLTKSSYFNIENISIGYTLPSKWTSKIGIDSLRIYAIAQNVWYWSARKGFDPRQGSGNTTTNATNYSPMRTISGGVTFRF